MTLLPLRPTHSRVIMAAAITVRDSTARYSTMCRPTAAWRAMAQGGPHQEAMAISLFDLDCSHFRSSLIIGHSQCPAACLKGDKRKLIAWDRPNDQLALIVGRNSF